MPEIIIPERLMERLEKDAKKQASVTNLQSKVQEIISESPYFFPDYTDHGIDHILALRGDLPEGASAEGLSFRYASDLTREIRDFGGFCIDTAVHFNRNL
jgi:5,10-methylenetetrahydrofolate reductase